MVCQISHRNKIDTGFSIFYDIGRIDATGCLDYFFCIIEC